MEEDSDAMGSFGNLSPYFTKCLRYYKTAKYFSWRILKMDKGQTGILELKSLYKNPKLRAAGCIQLLWSGVLWFKSFLVMQSKDGNIKIADGKWWHTVISYRSWWFGDIRITRPWGLGSMKWIKALLLFGVLTMTNALSDVGIILSKLLFP